MNLTLCDGCMTYQEIVATAGNFWTHEVYSYCKECYPKLEWKGLGEITREDWDNMEKGKPKNYVSLIMVGSGTYSRPTGVF